MDLAVAVGGLGLVAGLLSGLLGIGGGIVMTPLLLYAPPLLGSQALDMKTVAGLTIVQGLASCLSGGLTHRRFRFVSLPLSLWMGATIFAAALVGGAGAKFLANRHLLAIFAGMAMAAAALLLVPVPSDRDPEPPDPDDLRFSRPRAVATAVGVGLLGGLVGQGGSFILIPLMTSFLRIPTRIAIGSNLGIVFLSSLAGFLGKAATGQIAWGLALPVVATVLPAAHLGSRLSRHVPVGRLRFLLAVCILLAILRIGFSVFG